MVNFCFDIVVEVKRKGVSLGLEFHECHRRNAILWAPLNLLLLFQKEKLTIWTQLNLKTIKFQVPINLHFIKTYPSIYQNRDCKRNETCVGHVLGWVLLNSVAK